MPIEISVGSEGPEREIEAWLRLRPEVPGIKFLDDLEKRVGLYISEDDPPGWKEQPLYKDVIVQRIIRMALMHENLSHDIQYPGSYFTPFDSHSSLVTNKFPNDPSLHAYQALLRNKQIIFIGNVQDNSSVECVGLYLPDDNKDFRPVKNIHELMDVLGVDENAESSRIWFDEIASHLDHEAFVRDTFPRNVSRWLQERSIAPGSFRGLLDAIYERQPTRQTIIDLNAFTEGATTERHLGQHAFLNDLESEFRATHLRPIPLGRIEVPEDAARYVRVNYANERASLYKDGRIQMFVHPTTSEFMANIPNSPVISTDLGIWLYPTIGNRSGYVSVNGEILDIQLKMDIPRILSGWFRLCGLSTLKEETEAAKFLLKHKLLGHTPPDSLSIMPTTEGAVLNIAPDVNIATLVRSIPLEASSSVLIPGAFLYTKNVISGKTFLEECIAGKSAEETDEFVLLTLVEPLMRAWNYFLSLEDESAGENGLAFEMHGANFYYFYDLQNHRLDGHILTKDFASNRILRSNTNNPSASIEWLLGEYDHGFSYLYLHPLVNDLVRITGKPITYFEQIIRDAFVRLLTQKNKQKFLVDENVVGIHQDVYDQLSRFTAPRKKLFAFRPRFRPHDSSLYE